MKIYRHFSRNVRAKDVPDYALMLGNPARLCLAVAGGPAEVTGSMCECGHQIKFQDGLANCNECGKQYRQTGEEVKQI